MSMLKCDVCGEAHDLSDMEVGFEKPDAYFDVPPEERKHRVRFNQDLCIIDRQSFFIRGVLEIPVRGERRAFGWGIWVEIDEGPFERYVELFCDDAQGQEPPFEGRIATEIALYPQTRGVPVQVCLISAKQRPLFIVSDIAHPLGDEQRCGVGEERVLKILSSLLHA